MNKILWPLVAFCIAVSLYWMFTGIGPQAIPVINPSNFNSVSEIAEYTYRQLFPRIENQKIMIFGVEENRPEHKEILKKFVQLIAEGSKIPVVVISDTPVKPEDFLPAKIETLYLNDVEEGHRRQKINESIVQDKKIIFSLSTFDAIHFRKESMINVIEEGLQVKGISFVMAGIAMEPHEVTIATYCVSPVKDEMNYNPLACLVRTKSGYLQKNKKITRSKIVSTVEQQGERDFMIYTHIPNKI